MKKKEAIEELKKVMIVEVEECLRIKRGYIDIFEAIQIINKIYDGFEEQCVNCKFFGNDNGESWEEGYSQCVKERICKNCFYYAEGVCCCDKSPLITEIVDENFGCNRFERRGNERD